MRERILAAVVAALAAAALSLGAPLALVDACGRVLAEAVRFVSSWWFPG